MNNDHAFARMIWAVLAVTPAVVSAGPPVRDHNIVTDDYFTIGVITACAMSPQGRYVAYTEMRWQPPEEKRNVDLWVVSTETREPVRLTFETSTEGAPKWSPDGRWIYFTSNRKRSGEDKPPFDGKKQVWRVAVDGGELLAVTRVPGGIDDYDLSHDGTTLYYTVGKKTVDEDVWKPLREEFDKLSYGHGVDEYSQVWRLNLVTWRAEKLVDEHRVIHEFAVSPDDRRLAMITTPTSKLITNEGWSRVEIYDARTKKVTILPDRQWREQAPSPYGWLLGLSWSDDAELLAFRVDFDGYPGEVFVAGFNASGLVGSQKLIRPDEVTLTGGHLAWRPGTHDLVLMAEDHARRRAYCIPDIGEGRQGASLMLTPGDVVLDTFSVGRLRDRMAIVMSDVTHPPDVFLVPLSGEKVSYDRVTGVNPQVDTWKLPKIQTVQWKSKDGTKVEGILELPPDYEPGSPLPMVVEIHGGPTAAAHLRFRFWIYGRVLFPARGWALLSVNYRGSTGFGDKFLTDLIGHKNDLDVQDILSGVDAMVERGIADPDRLAVMGWSNGGYLTDCLITRTNRFKAASSGAGVFDTVLQWLVEDTPGHVINFNQGFPWNKTQQMQRGSALYNVDKVTTPTLIHVGEKDSRCPPGHSKGLYRALHHYLHVPAELIVYPGEGHGLTQYRHRKAKMEWDIKWFDHYVLGKTPDEEVSKAAATID